MDARLAKTPRLRNSLPVRLERTERGAVATGYAAVFYRSGEPGTEFQLYHDLVERIAPSAFDRALREKHDARGLFNHDDNQLPLGRVSAGTLKLSVDERGLKYEIDLPDTQLGRDVAISIERGDVTGSSFAFTVPKGGQAFERGNTMDIRTILDVDLFDVGPVTYPAYEATTAAMRSGGADEAIQARDAWRAERQREADAVQVRADLVARGLA